MHYFSASLLSGMIPACTFNQSVSTGRAKRATLTSNLDDIKTDAASPFRAEKAGRLGPYRAVSLALPQKAIDCGKMQSPLRLVCHRAEKAGRICASRADYGPTAKRHAPSIICRTRENLCPRGNLLLPSRRSRAGCLGLGRPGGVHGGIANASHSEPAPVEKNEP